MNHPSPSHKNEIARETDGLGWGEWEELAEEELRGIVGGNDSFVYQNGNGKYYIVFKEGGFLGVGNKTSSFELNSDPNSTYGFQYTNNNGTNVTLSSDDYTRLRQRGYDLGFVKFS